MKKRPIDHLRPVPEPKTGPDEDTVVRLLQLAGRRPAAPEEDTARVRAAAHARWRRAVAVEQRRRWATRGAGGFLAAAAVVLLVLATGLFERPVVLSGEPIATVELLTGRAVVAGETEELLAVGVALHAGTVIETRSDPPGAPASRAALRTADGTSLRLDTGSRLRLISSSAVALERGTVYVDSQAPAASLEVRTALGVARDVGTQFEVRLAADESAVRLRVREGLVQLSHGGEAHEATAGVELTLRSDGSVDQRAVPVSGPEWRWVLDVLPAFDAEGRTLGELLEWAAREAGWELRFADAALAAEASEIVLSGSLEGLSPEDAVAAFLIASGLSYHLEDGVLTIDGAD